MTRDVAPTGYIRLKEATRLIADIDEFTEAEVDFKDVGDWHNEAIAIDDATREMRQALCDGQLTGYYFVGDGKAHPVPEGTWTDAEACLKRAGPDMGFEYVYHFHARGIEVGGVRWPIFLIEQEFEKLRQGEIEPKKSLAPKTKRPVGRPRDSGFDDKCWLDEMEKYVQQGSHTPYQAANRVAYDRFGEIRKKPGTDVQSIIDRLYRKYMRSDRPKVPLDSD
jgi:hypothetical protein